jgi:hypothetical protein
MRACAAGMLWRSTFWPPSVWLQYCARRAYLSGSQRRERRGRTLHSEWYCCLCLSMQWLGFFRIKLSPLFDLSFRWNQWIPGEVSAATCITPLISYQTRSEPHRWIHQRLGTTGDSQIWWHSKQSKVGRKERAGFPPSSKSEWFYSRPGWLYSAMADHNSVPLVSLSLCFRLSCSSPLFISLIASYVSENDGNA